MHNFPQGKIHSMIKTNEVVLKVNNECLHFAEPKQIIVANTLEDVLPALRETERLVNVNEWYAAGFLSYEAASAFDPALRTKVVVPTEDSTVQDVEFPFLWFGLYPGPRVITLPEPEHQKENLDWQPTTDRDTYKSSIDQIREHIAEGRTYQVNFKLKNNTSPVTQLILDLKNNMVN